MAAPVQTGLAYADLRHFPDDNLRRELLGGDLFVTPAPRTRHQAVVTNLLLALGLYARQRGAAAFTAPLDVFFNDKDVVEPDLVYLVREHRDQIEKLFVRGAPDIVVEVSSPSTRTLDLRRKRDLYEHNGVPEYWYVDLEADRIEVYRLDERGLYQTPTLHERGTHVTSRLLPVFALAVNDALGEADPG